MVSPSFSPSPKHPFLRHLRVSGGYLDGLDASLSPGGNVALGEPGSGKSTALAFMRYVLKLPVPPTRRGEFDSLIATNLGSGRAYVTVVTAHGAEYVLSRSGGEAGPRLESGGEDAPSVDAILAMVPVRFAGHGELELLATDGLARLVPSRGAGAREGPEPLRARRGRAHDRAAREHAEGAGERGGARRPVAGHSDPGDPRPGDRSPRIS